MGRTTDELIALAYEVSERPDPRELDLLLSVGERVACALVAMAVADLGREAISLTGSQAGIVTDTVHTKAKIVEVRADRINRALDEDRIVLVAGFQGMSTDRDITTLGRGGSDTTAVALAAALGAEVCEIYADSEGVFTADPRVVHSARRLRSLTYDEMLELAAAGMKALQLRSVELARNHGVRLHVRSPFSDEQGTWVTKEDEQMPKKATISAVTHSLEEAVYRVHGVTPATLFAALAERRVNVDTIVQTSTDVIVFSAALADRAATAAALDALGASWSEHDDLGKIGVVGGAMEGQPGIAARTFATLHELGIEAQFVSSSPITIAFYVPHAEVERVVEALHAAFGLAARETVELGS
jgi:aspartate kinase